MSGAALLLAMGGRVHAVGVAGSDPYGYFVAVQGTLAPTTYTDNGGNTRTINVIQDSVGGGTTTFRLNGSVANNDTAFVAIVVNGVKFLRSAASYTSPSYSQWSWASSNPLGTSGTKTLVIL